MHQQKAGLSLAMILALAATSAFAADAGHEQRHPGTMPPAATATPTPAVSGMPSGATPGTSAGMPMKGMMQQMMMGQSGMAGHTEGRIAFLKTELKITEAQQPLWTPVADAIRANAQGMADMPNGMAMTGSAATLPDKLAMHEKMMAAHLDGLRKLRAAVEPLYAAFNADQRKTADELMIGPMGMIGMRVM